jgi:hypothetical protein
MAIIDDEATSDDSDFLIACHCCSFSNLEI